MARPRRARRIWHRAPSRQEPIVYLPADTEHQLEIFLFGVTLGTVGMYLLLTVLGWFS